MGLCILNINFIYDLLWTKCVLRYNRKVHNEMAIGVCVLAKISQFHGHCDDGNDNGNNEYIIEVPNVPIPFIKETAVEVTALMANYIPFLNVDVINIHALNSMAVS